MITTEEMKVSPFFSELKVTYRRSPRKERTGSLSRPVLNSPEGTVEYLRSVWDDGTLDLREEVVAVYLSAGLEVNGWVRLFAGCFDAAPLDPRILFGVALQTASPAVILAHNHPCGSPEPSVEDWVATERLRAAGVMLRIGVIEHVILTRDEFFCFSTSAGW